MRVANTLKGRYRLFSHLKTLAEGHEDARIVLVYEASYCGFTIHDDCVAAGIECHILAPTKLRKSHSDKQSKHDKLDAQFLLETLKGHLLAANELPAIWIPDDETRDDRELVRSRILCGEKLTAIKAQIQAFLKRNGVVKDPEAGTAWTKQYCRWLRGIELKPSAQQALDCLLRQMDFMQAEMATLEGQIEALSKTTRYEEAARALQEQIKGVGLLTAMVYLTEMGDLSRFKNRRHVGAFLGYVPTSDETGDPERKGRITRGGPSRVRWILDQAAWARIRSDRKENQFYWRIADRNPQHKKKAAVACARRLGVLMWHIGLEAQQKAGVFEATA